MKKMILILILVIPVLIAMVITLIAGFVGRETTFPAIQAVYIPEENYKSKDSVLYTEFRKHGSEIALRDIQEGKQIWEIDQITVGVKIDLKNVLKVDPARAKFSDLNRKYSRTYYSQGEPGSVPQLLTEEIKSPNTPPVIMNDDGFLEGLSASNETITIDVMVGTAAQFTLEIERVVE